MMWIVCVCVELLFTIAVSLLCFVYPSFVVDTPTNYDSYYGVCM